MLNSATMNESPARRVGESAAALLAAGAVLALFLISNLMLSLLGVSYDVSGGAQWQKIHPATYLALASLGFLALSRFDPVILVDEVVRHHKGLLVFFFAWLLLLGHIVFFVGSPITAVIDTFLLPMLMLVLLTRVSEGQASRLALFLHVAMAANAALGIWEFAGGFRVTPLIAQGVALTGDWRSTALLGHPLQNATITAVYAFILIQGGGRDLSGLLRPLAFLLQLAALAAFGGRAATAMFIAFGAVAAVVQVARIVQTRSITARGAATFALVLTVGIVAASLLVAGGYFDQFASRFVSDEGSFNARISMFKLLGEIPYSALLAGPSPEYVATLQRLEGIEFGIESFWVAMIANYGILISIPFFIGLTAFLFDLKRVTRSPSGWTILLFVAICSTSASLSGKTTGFAEFAVMLLLLLRPVAERAPTHDGVRVDRRPVS